MRKKLKGSAMLWAICSLMVVALILTGLLAINKAYAEDEINNIASRRAEYLARSGIELTSDLIIKDALIPGDKSIDTITEGRDITVGYEWGNVKVIRQGAVIRLISEAEAGNAKESVVCLMDYDSVRSNWRIKGYVTY